MAEKNLIQDDITGEIYTGDAIPHVIAKYTSTYQSVIIAGGDYASVDVDLSTVEVGSVDVADTTPFTYTSSANETVDVTAQVRFVDDANLIRHVFAINVEGVDAAVTFVPVIRGGYAWMSLHSRITLQVGDVLKLVVRVKNTEATDPLDLIIDAGEITITSI